MALAPEAEEVHEREAVLPRHREQWPARVDRCELRLDVAGQSPPRDRAGMVQHSVRGAPHIDFQHIDRHRVFQNVVGPARPRRSRFDGLHRLIQTEGTGQRMVGGSSGSISIEIARRLCHLRNVHAMPGPLRDGGVSCGPVIRSIVRETGNLALPCSNKCLRIQRSQLLTRH